MPRDRRNFEYRDNRLMVCDGHHGKHQDCEWRDATSAEVLEYYGAGERRKEDPMPETTEPLMEALSWNDIGVGITYAQLEDRVRPHFATDGFCGFDVPDGWLQLVCALHEKLKLVDPEYVLDQAKEKFAELRYYVTLSDKCKDREAAEDLLRQAARRSVKTCQNCGQPGEVSGKYWLAVKCMKCLAG